MKRRRGQRSPPKSASGLDPSQWATAGVCVFVLGFAAPIPSQIPLAALVVFALVAAFRGSTPRPVGVPRLYLAAITGYLALTGLSILLSEDHSRSLELSASWIPGVLLFVVLSDRLRTAQQLRAVYASFSVVSLGLGLALLVGRWAYGAGAHDWLPGLGFPVLVVPNDCHLLALLTPFSLVLAERRPRSALGFLAMASIVVSTGAILALGSRGGALSLIACLALTGAFLRPRLGVVLGGASLLAMAVGDAALGFPLLSKFTHVVDTRISLWILAWEMFLDAPWLGHGPHTYRLLYTAYLESITFPDWVRPDPWGTAVPWAHNLYLELLAERGIIGFLSFFSVIGTAFVYLARALRRKDPELAALAAGCGGALLGFLLSGVFEASLLRIWAVVLLFSLWGIVAQLAVLSAEADAGRSEEALEKR